MRPVTCPLGFTERNLPAGAELPAAWRPPPAQAARAPAPARAATPPPDDAYVPGVEPGPAAPLCAAVTPDAEALYLSSSLREAAQREHDRDVGVGGGQLEPGCYALLCLSFVAMGAELSPRGLAVAALCGVALGACVHQQFGLGPNLRRSRQHLAAGRYAAAEEALAWHPARGEALLHLAEARRRQRQWRGAATALLRLEPNTPELTQALVRQLEAVAARYAGALEAFAVDASADLEASVDAKAQPIKHPAPADGASSGCRVGFVESRGAR